MKKGLTILTTLFLTLSLVSCGDKKQEQPKPSEPNVPVEPEKPDEENKTPDNQKPDDKPEENDKPNTNPDENKDPETKPDDNKPETPSLYKDSVELFNASLKKMQSSTYEVKGFGPSNTNTVTGNSVLYIYEDLKHTPDELYFEKVSNGEPVKVGPIKIGVSFARKAYIKGNVGRRQDGEIKDPWKIVDNYPVVNTYNEPYDATPSSILNDFGKVKGSYINFIINENTITENSKTYKFENDIYTMNFDIKIDNGVDSEGIGGYKNQVNTMSGKTLDNVESINLNIKLDKDLKVIEYTSKENYIVDAGMLGIKANVSNNLTYKFNYYDNSSDLVIKPFNN